MKLTLTDLNVIVDTLIGSEYIMDGGNIWKYSATWRSKVGKKLLSEMSKVNIRIEIDE